MPARTRVGAEEDIQPLEWRGIAQSGREGSEKRASRGHGCEGTYRMFFFTSVRVERTRLMLTGNK